MVLDTGEILISDYVNARSKVKIQCNNGHSYEITPNNYKKGRRCRECFKIRQQNMMNDRWKGVVNSVVEQYDYNMTTPDKVNLNDSPLYNTYLKFFVKLKKDGVMKVTPSNDKRQFTLDCRGNVLDIWVLDTIHDKHPNDIYPIYLDCSVYKTDEAYINDWATKVIRGD